MDNGDDVISQAIDLLAVVGWIGGGAAVGVLLGALVVVAAAVVGRRYPLVADFRRLTQWSFLFTAAVAGAWVGFDLGRPTTENIWVEVASRVFLLLVIGGIGAFTFASCGIITELADKRARKDPLGAKRIHTQTDVLQRALRSTVVVATVVSLLLTFPAARAPLASLLGAAGILSVVTGLAAQSTLGNVIAGIQLAFTDAIRVGDTLTVHEGVGDNTGVVEELTLTYVVLRTWNRKRILFPSSYFTSEPFDNWTRHGSDQMGQVLLQLDWPVPMDQVRGRVKEILDTSEYWDRDDWHVQMVDTGTEGITVSIGASASDPSNRVSLEAQIRESLVTWLNEEMPWAFPRWRGTADVSHTATQPKIGPSTTTGKQIEEGGTANALPMEP